MRIVAIVDTEDCGPFVVLDEDNVSVIKCSDFYIAATNCAFTGRALTAEITEECAEKLIQNGVKCLDFNEEAPLTKEATEKKTTD
jgi:hypothetical protein